MRLLFVCCQRLDIDHAALGLPGRLDGAHLEGLGVFLEQVVGHIGDGALSLHGLLGVGQTQCQHHLVLPQRDGVHDGGLDLFGHHGVVVAAAGGSAGPSARLMFRVSSRS